MAAIEQLEESEIGGVSHLPPVGKIRRNLKSKSRTDSHNIELSLSLSEGEGGERNAALLINHLVAEMQEHRRMQNSGKLKQRQQLLRETMKELRKEVENKEDQALEFVRQKGGPGTWREKLSSLFLRRASLRGNLEQLELGIGSSEKELEHLREEIKNHPEYTKLTETVGTNPIWLSQMERLIALEVQRTGLIASGTGENAPGMQSIEAQIKDIEDRLSTSISNEAITSVANGVSPLYNAVQERLINLRTSIIRAQHNLPLVKAQLEKVESELTQLLGAIPENEMLIEKMEREIEFRHELTKETFARILQTDILINESDPSHATSGAGNSIGGLEVVDGAVPRKIPTSPRVKAIVAIAGIVGLALGVSVALLMEYFSTTYSSLEEVESDLDTAHLGRAPEPNGTSLGDHSISEGFQEIAANINLSNPGINKQVIMFAGCDHDDHVSEITANLGVTLALAKTPVLVVDCNLLAQKQRETFGIASDTIRQPTQIETFTDWQQAIQKTEFAHVDLFSISSVASTPVEFLDSSRLQVLFEQFREHYELVLIDAPPLLASADGLALGTHADAIVLIFNLSTTSRQSLRTARDRVTHANLSLHGFITT
ncbi:MAG: hypothetical protein OXN17_05100 [Candidatus Poribacteria bacterium]|nr:hypothetical protein [Candidatus Poribacteria bacterium]